MRMHNALAGYVAMIVPTLLILFGLFMAVVVGWRNWFGLGTKDLSKKKKKPTAPTSPRSKPRPDRK